MRCDAIVDSLPSEVRRFSLSRAPALHMRQSIFGSRVCRVLAAALTCEYSLTSACIVWMNDIEQENVVCYVGCNSIHENSWIVRSFVCEKHIGGTKDCICGGVQHFITKWRTEYIICHSIAKYPVPQQNVDVGHTYLPVQF